MLKFLPRIRTLTSTLAGFTMIELLIVITILGILATAVLSAINPIEQINRGRDTGSRSDAEQLVSAIDRYNAFQQYYPWQNGQADVTGMDLAMTLFTMAAPANTNVPPCAISVLLAAGSTGVPPCEGAQELKESFITRVTAATARGLFIYNRGTQGDSTYVCFVPQSGAFRTEAENRCTAGYPADVDSTTEDIICDNGTARSGSVNNMTTFAGQGAAICLP